MSASVSNIFASEQLTETKHESKTEGVQCIINAINLAVSAQQIPNARTDNGAPAFSSTNNSILDAFSHFVRNIDEVKMTELLNNCWAISPEKTVQLIAQTRDCRGGKGEKTLGQNAMFWLRQNKPMTYLLNLELFASLGYYKDLLRIVERAEKEKAPLLGNKNYIELEYLAHAIQKDNVAYSSGSKGITLVSKWAPTEGTQYDMYARRIAKILFPTSNTRMAEYRKVLSKLRAHLKVVERSMCLNQWDTINFGQVPSTAHKRLKKAFGKHQKDRYVAYLGRVKEGKEVIKTAGIQPHELVNEYLGTRYVEVNETTEAQWKTLVGKLASSTNLGKSLAVVDVSGSMSGGNPSPLSVAVSLGLVLCSLARGPFNKRLITFSSIPTLHEVTGDTMMAQVQSITRMHWEMNTNFKAVFELLLRTATMYDVKQENMIETVFVFTDMQFDSVDGSTNEKTLYGEVKTMYETAGYKVPKLVFWNLSSGTSAFPIKSDTPNTALVSGFSSDLMKLFISGEDFTPDYMLNKALSKYLVRVHPLENQYFVRQAELILPIQ